MFRYLGQDDRLKFIFKSLVGVIPLKKKIDAQKIVNDYFFWTGQSFAWFRKGDFSDEWGMDVRKLCCFFYSVIHFIVLIWL